MNTNYSEQIFQSIDTIISQRLNEVSFDKTEICEIVSQDKDNENKYWVSNGSLKYEAYSIDENRKYLANQKVYVTIPQGNYDLRKLIIGSYSADETNENLYVNPFNHLVTSSTLTLPKHIWAKANSIEYDDWNDIPTDTTKLNSVEFLTEFKYSNSQNFDYIGLDFSFSTNITGYQGSYALRISLWNGDTELTNQNDNTLILSSKNLYGNPYNLNSSLSFQHLFPWPTREKDDKIEPIPITEITKIKLQLIQDNNFLKQQGGTNVNTDTWIELTKADLKFGYDVKNITKDELQLILEEGQSLKYTTGETAAARNLYLDWKHFDTFNNPYIFNIHQSPNIFEEYTVYWLHYVDGLGENIDLPDKYAWNWETISFDQSLTKLINLTTQFRTDQYKVVIKYTTNKFTEEQKNNITNFNDVLKPEYKQLLLDLKNPNLTEEEKVNKKTRLEEIRNNKELVNSYYTYTESTGLVFNNTDVAANPGASNSSEDSLRIKLDENDIGIYNVYGLDGRMMDYSYRGPHNIHFEFLDATPFDRIANIKWDFPSENTMIKDVAYTDDKRQATFNIDTMYKPGAMNNRIWCTVTLVTGEIRRGSLTLQFGDAAAAGSNYAFNIDFVGNRTCLYATGKEDSVEIQATFTKQNGEVMTVPAITWSWMNDYNSPITLPSPSYTGKTITLKYTGSKVPENNYSILQAKIDDYAIDNGLTTNLTAYLPIPIAKPGYNYISGATRVVYDSNGNTATYSRNPYKLYEGTNKIEGTSWHISSNPTNDTLQLKEIGEETTLRPLSYIPQDPPMTCVYCKLYGNTVWSQPILIMQNRWEYDLLNGWNGKLNINDEQGYMLAPLLGAGKKENNGFTGVIMGDLKIADGSVANTGLYGFKEGSRRFSFNDKGEAYIGTGDYYIDFNGKDLSIKAKNFDLNAHNGALVISDKEGIKLSDKISINPDGTANIGGWSIMQTYLECKKDDNNKVFLHQPSDWTDMSGGKGDVLIVKNNGSYPFCLYADGTLNCTKANIEGTITATTGSIGGWKIGSDQIYNKNDDSGYTFTLWNPAIAQGHIISCSNSSGDQPFYVTRTGFLKATNADITGVITATDGYIGGWQISSKRIYNTNPDTGYTFSLWNPAIAEGHIISCYNENNGDQPFYVTRNGYLKANNAYITGTLEVGSIISDGVKIGNSQRSIFGDFKAEGISSVVTGTCWSYGNSISFPPITPSFYLTESVCGMRAVTKPGTVKPSLMLDKDGSITIVATNTSPLYTSSDERVKNTITPLDNKYEILFDNLNAVSYKYNNGTSDRLHTGFIAQAVEKAINDAGLTTKDFAGLTIQSPNTENEIYGLRYEEFIALNTWQIQKLKTRVTELENEIKEIKQRYEIQ